MHLTSWKARRAGGRITINGKDEQGKDAKIVGVDVIEPRIFNGVPGIYATDKNGDVHRLMAA
ncbi:hypothetical protein [Sphingomonas sp.]|uniref:hypothetical protein n=1 Tax=Sphingomonas sp. TaxID=28214 RepID=UPI003BA8ACF8